MTGEAFSASDPADTHAQAELRASHADRDRVVEVLRIAAGDGRLTADELDERLEAALTARTLSELAVLTTDLPPATQAPYGSVELAQPKDLVRIECDSGSAGRDGVWVVPRRMEIRVTSGVVTLDFTRAAIALPALTIDADVKGGALTLLTRPGVVVDAGDVTVSGGAVQVKPQLDPAEPVILRIEISGRVRGGVISARPPRLTSPRRTFLQWLLRRPKRPALPA